MSKTISSHAIFNKRACPGVPINHWCNIKAKLSRPLDPKYIWGSTAWQVNEFHCSEASISRLGSQSRVLITKLLRLIYAEQVSRVGIKGSTMYDSVSYTKKVWVWCVRLDSHINRVVPLRGVETDESQETFDNESACIYIYMKGLSMILYFWTFTSIYMYTWYIYIYIYIFHTFER